MERKGTSPLIAAVLLIVFTVAVGTLIMNWMTTYTKSTTESAGTETSTTMDCAKQIIDITDIKQSGGNVTVLVQNLGSITTNMTKVLAYDSNGNTCDITTTAQTISAGDLKIIGPVNCSSAKLDTTSFTVRVTTACGGVYDEQDYPVS